MSAQVPHGYCKCGCGQKAPVAKQTDARRGWVKGEPKDFVHGHHARGAGNPKWEGGRIKDNGYVRIWKPDHPRADANGYVLEHILVVEAAMGRPLPEGAQVHHVNGQKDDNRPENLVVCPDTAHHRLLHCRAEALEESGHADYRKCRFCGEWDDPDEMYTGPNRNAHHRDCANEYNRRLKRERRAEA